MTPSRVRALVLALAALLVLILVHGMERSLESHTRLRAMLIQKARGDLAVVLPQLAQALRGGGDLDWRHAAELAVDAGVATEFEVFTPEGQRLYAGPEQPTVTHRPSPAQLETLRREQALFLGPFSGTAGRLLIYLSFEQNPRPVMVRLSLAVPEVGADIARYRELMVAHGLGLLAVVIIAALVLAPSAWPDLGAPGALGAYEEVLTQLQAHGRSVNQQHQAERQRLERAMHERAAMASAGELTAGIVHEVRNGLATIMGHARLLAPVAGAQEAAEAIVRECETLEAVVRRFLDFIREESLDQDVFDLRRFLERVVGREARRHPGCEVLLPSEDLGSLTGDENLLERAFENLVRNALEAAGDAGHVRIAVSRGEDRVRIFIDDDGPGLDPSMGPRPRAFFSTKAGGTGLGLATADKIVRLHGGELRLEPITARGVRAWVELPENPPPA
jgi:signal transduction histidine kinase